MTFSTLVSKMTSLMSNLNKLKDEETEQFRLLHAQGWNSTAVQELSDFLHGISISCLRVSLYTGTLGLLRRYLIYTDIPLHLSQRIVRFLQHGHSG